MGCLKLTYQEPALTVIHRRKTLTYGKSDLKARREQQDEIAGTGNHYTAPYWEYDPRTGRRWNVDPLANHPMQIGMSPYSTFWNNPIYWTDPTGLCPDCDDNNPDAETGTVYRPEGAEHDYIKGDDGKWTMIYGDLDEVTITGEAPKTEPNKVGGVTVQREGEEFVFPKGGDIYMPFQRPENLEFWKKNYDKFVKPDGNIASFNEVFMSKDEWWNEVGTDMAVELFQMAGTNTGDFQKGRLIPTKKFESWRWHFPARTAGEAKLKAARASEIQEMNLLRSIPRQALSFEESARLYQLENKWAE